MENITREQVIEALEKVVEQYGEDYNYGQAEQDAGITAPKSGPMCRYADGDGEPLCIIGKALARMGVSGSVLVDIEFGGKEVDGCPVHMACAAESAAAAPHFIKTLRDAGYVFDDDALAAMQRAQRVQDSGHAWGRALRVAVDPEA